MLRLAPPAISYFVAVRTHPPQDVNGATIPMHDSVLSSQPGVIIMGDNQDRPALALLLEALIASALIGTFVIYGYPNFTPGPPAGPGEVAKLAAPR